MTNTPDDRDRILARQREALGEAHITPDMPADVETLALMEISLEDQQARLDQLAEEDPVGLVWAQELGRDDWIDRRTQ